MSTKESSLDAPLSKESETNFLSRLVYDSDSQEDHFSAAEQAGRLKDSVSQAMDTLSSREQYVIENRILREEGLTLKEIADHMDLSKERVRQIEVQALKTLREKLIQVAV
jgi:RNA polymerase sigma-32 factor